MAIMRKKQAITLSSGDLAMNEVEQDMSLADAAQQAGSVVRGKRKKSLTQNMGLAAFLFGVIIAALTVGLSAGANSAAYLTMFLATCFGVLLAAYRFQHIAIVTGALQTLIYAVYVLYAAIGAGKAIVLMDYLWLFLPILCIASMVLFMTNMRQVEQMSDMLEGQLQRMELVDPVTGLSNLRCMYMELERRLAYARRNDIEVSLIIFQLRYYRELRSILTAAQMAELKRRMGRMVEETLRLEDRVYAIDDEGSLGVVCIGCGAEGAVIVKERLKALLTQRESFEGIVDRLLRVDVRTGLCTYNKEEIRNVIEFKQRAENELQYDV